jgi:hypothetical protein
VSKQRQPGKFWPWVRSMILEKAQVLYQMEQAKTMGEDFKAITAERKELRESGYFYTAKLIVLRNLWREKKGLALHRREGNYAWPRAQGNNSKAG